MSVPRLEIDLGKIHHNAHTLVGRLARRGISVTGVTKAGVGSADIANAMLRAGVTGLGDSRIENIEALRGAQLSASMTLIRSPMISQAMRVVMHADVSFNTELAVIGKLSIAAGAVRRTHGIVLMVELGDLREGIMPCDLERTVREVLRLPNIELRGIGANLACLNGVSPDDKNMAQLSALTESIEATIGQVLGTVSGGNSGSLSWALSGADTGRINELRLGEAILLGREPLHREAIEGLHTDAFILVGEVIEAKTKPSQPWGTVAQSAFGAKPRAGDRGDISQAILAIGQQDTDPAGLEPPPGVVIIGSSSDHVIADTGPQLPRIGAEMRFQPNYAALVRAMTSPFVVKLMVAAPQAPAVALARSVH